ncbi:MAG TPA: DUF1573 domain-containing protein [Ignavibacteria bacterium]|nr:DUF1573 domain-containing protein [Ignavibacteria bacterium]
MNTGKTGKILFLIVGILLVGAFSAFLVNKNMNDPKSHPPVITFTEEKINMGDVQQGPQVNGEFEFKNTGHSVLVIKNKTPNAEPNNVLITSFIVPSLSG